MSVERYRQPIAAYASMIPEPAGPWCLFEDYQATQQQLDQLLEAVKVLKEVVDDGDGDPQVLRAEQALYAAAEEIEKERKS